MKILYVVGNDINMFLNAQHSCLTGILGGRYIAIIVICGKTINLKTVISTPFTFEE